jgi:probable HAF family extracellular repeat protein
MTRALSLRTRLLCASLLAVGFMRPTGEAAPALAVVLVKEDLGTLPGDTASVAYGINGSRHIVGHSFGPGGNTAFIWTPPGPMIPLPAPEGVSLYFASDINESGQVVGSGFGLEFAFDAYIWTPPGDVIGLGDVGLFDEFGSGINNLGWAVGGGEVPPIRPFIYIPPGPNALVPGTNAETGQGNDLNDGGEVVGSTQLWSPGTSRPFYWSFANGLHQLQGFDNDSAGAAESINISGAIAGLSTSGGVQRAAVWPGYNQPPVDLGTLGGPSARANKISNNAVVVGAADVGVNVRHAFRRPPGGPMQDLGTLGGTNSEANGVNGAGHAVGEADLANGNGHATAWWRYTNTNSFACNCQPWPTPPSWPSTLRAVLITSGNGLRLRELDAATLTLGDGDGNDAPVAEVRGRRLVLSGDFNGDGERDLLVGFDSRHVAADSPRGKMLWLVGAVLDRSRGIYGAIRSQP